MANSAGSKVRDKRTELRRELWPNERHFEIIKGQNGWFMVFRTLPLILKLIRDKNVSGGSRLGDPGNVYLDLLSRHMSDGVVEISNEADNAYAAGYTGNRAVHSWRERLTLVST